MDPPVAQEALAALERLTQRNVLTSEEGRHVGQLLTGDPAFDFSPRQPEAPGGAAATE